MIAGRCHGGSYFDTGAAIRRPSVIPTGGSRMRMKAVEAQRLRNRVAIVTGGAGPNSLGRSISTRFAEEGAKVAVTDVDLAGAEAVAEEIRIGGGTAIALIATCATSHAARPWPSRWRRPGTGRSRSS